VRILLGRDQAASMPPLTFLSAQRLPATALVPQRHPREIPGHCKQKRHAAEGSAAVGLPPPDVVRERRSAASFNRVGSGVADYYRPTAWISELQERAEKYWFGSDEDENDDFDLVE